MFKTDTNLQSAFSEECQTYLRYTMFAIKADAEGFPELAKLFRASAAAEMTHVRNHFTAMGAMGTTKTNLLAAATSEQQALSSLYPAFIDQSKSDGNEGARITFEYAFKAEKVHNQLFEKALETFKAGQKVSNQSYFFCQVCGNLVTQEIPPKCDICGNGQDKFASVE